MAKKETKVICYISVDGADPVLWDSLTPEEKQSAKEKMCERLSRSMSDYYSQHLEEFERI